MKQIAILKYQFMFDPSQAWSSGSQFEASLADFFAAHGFESNVVETKGGNSERVIWLEQIYTPQKMAQQVPQPKDSKPSTEQIKQIQQATPTKTYKQYAKPSSQENAPQKLNFKHKNDLRKTIHKLPKVNFRKVK